MRHYEAEPAAIVRVMHAVPEIQRLWWLAECVHRKGIALSGNNAPAFPTDEMECVRLLCRIAANQPALATGPELQRHIPLRADRWMSLTDRSHEALNDLDLPDDPELAEQLASEITQKRHFALDHVAVVEVDELEIDRIVLAPEERADDRAMVGVVALVEHRRGCFAVRCVVMTPEQATVDSVRARLMPGDEHTLTFAPAFMTERTMTAGSPLALIVLSAWRDLVVAEVRDQQYETEVLRKAKGKGRKGRQVEVIRYLPRRVALRMAEQAAREATGQPMLRRLFPVGAFAKRLPAGQRRSAEAEAFAAEIGIPLAEHQTVVRPHWRGGTEEERGAAAEADDAPERIWRSWSAVDLLRTRRRDGA
jgi:hypothetical protein